MNKTNETDKAALELLQQMEQELSNRLEKLNKDITKDHSRDSTEQAVERENDEVITSLLNETKQELQQVKIALIRMELGIYRVCSSCENEINADRLHAIPFTTLCFECANGRESI